MENRKENTTKYGEEVCTEFGWLPIEIREIDEYRIINT